MPAAPASTFDIIWFVQPDKVKGGYKGTISIPVSGHRPVHVTTHGATPKDAVARAAAAAQAITDSPVLRAVLPPGSGLAIDAVKKIASSTNIGETLKEFAGPGAARLAKVLGF